MDFHSKRYSPTSQSDRVQFLKSHLLGEEFASNCASTGKAELRPKKQSASRRVCCQQLKKGGLTVSLVQHVIMCRARANSGAIVHSEVVNTVAKDTRDDAVSHTVNLLNVSCEPTCSCRSVADTVGKLPACRMRSTYRPNMHPAGPRTLHRRSKACRGVILISPQISSEGAADLILPRVYMPLMLRIHMQK